MFLIVYLYTHTHIKYIYKGIFKMYSNEEKNNLNYIQSLFRSLILN